MSTSKAKEHEARLRKQAQLTALMSEVSDLSGVLCRFVQDENINNHYGKALVQIIRRTQRIKMMASDFLQTYFPSAEQ
jgi:hypothetical protein